MWTRVKAKNWGSTLPTLDNSNIDTKLWKRRGLPSIALDISSVSVQDQENVTERCVSYVAELWESDANWISLTLLLYFCYKNGGVPALGVNMACWFAR